MKILIADDDTFFQKFYSSQLKESGYEVDVAVNGIEALEKLKSFKPDLMLLDLIMPEKDGFEVLAEKAADPELKPIPVIIFSTLGQEQDIKKTMDLGAHGYINKSFFDFDALVAKIKETIK
ncbi:N/A [soil metagenome]